MTCIIPGLAGLLLQGLGRLANELPMELSDLSELPASPPGTVTPIYVFRNVGGGISLVAEDGLNLSIGASRDTAALKLYLRIAQADSSWSVPITLNDASTFYFFASPWAGVSYERWRIIRVRVH